MAHNQAGAPRRAFTLSRAFHTARYANTSVNMMALETYTKVSKMAENLELLIALGHSAIDYNREPWISLTGAVQLAHTLSRSKIGVRDTYTEKQKEALRCAQIVAVWKLTDTVKTMAQATAARGQIMNLLRTSPPTAAEFLSTLKAAVAVSGQPDTIVFPRDAFATELGLDVHDLNHVEYPRQKLDFYRARLNVIWLGTLTLTPQWEQYFQVLANLELSETVPQPEVTELTINAQNFIQDWHTQTDDQILAYYEMRGLVLFADTATMSIQATIVALISFLKGETMTDAWLDSRMERCRPINPAIDWDAVFNNDLITTFAMHFGDQGMSLDDIYKILQSVYSNYQDELLSPIRWMVEQAIVRNVTLAVTFAESVLKPMHVPLDKLIAIIGETQFAALVELAVNLMHDRLCAFIKPPVVVAQYGDLAYLGYYIELTQRGKNKTISFAGNPITKATKNRTDLEAIANSLLKFSESVVTAEMSIADAVNDPAADVVYHEIDGEIFKTPKANLLVPDLQPGAAQTSVMEDEPLQRSRLTWPRIAKALPRGTEKVSYQAIIATMKANESDRAKSLRFFLGKIISLAKQVELEVIPEDRLNITQRLKPIDPDTVGKAALWGYDVPQEWRAVPDIPIVPMPAALLTSQITKLSRGIIANPGVAGGLGAQGIPPPPAGAPPNLLPYPEFDPFLEDDDN